MHSLSYAAFICPFKKYLCIQIENTVISTNQTELRTETKILTPKYNFQNLFSGSPV